MFDYSFLAILIALTMEKVLLIYMEGTRSKESARNSVVNLGLVRKLKNWQMNTTQCNL